ncbi:GlsB/YeaQ/YmgE family stress response membrane protein [Marimonas sp. MJW-29]|uniref:GlsB/YeaQ/YmgE family stress response membrane protein n=1 Tax=Sulfitobacter sediminis TaxID=3234186 RepID=A0ABV3RKL5_9RHOB
MEDTAGTIMGGLAGLVIIVVIGAIVGWVASLVVKGRGSGLFPDVAIGIGGALVAGYLFPIIGLPIHGILGAFLGAVILLLVVKLIRRR